MTHIHTEHLPLFVPAHTHDGRGTAPVDTACPECRMVRRTDPPTSRDAAERVKPKLSELQARILALFLPPPGIWSRWTAKEIEALR